MNQVGHEHPAADLVPRRDEDATKKGSSVRGGLGGNMVGSGSGWALSMLYIVRRRGRGGRLVKRGLVTGTTSRAGRESGVHAYRPPYCRNVFLIIEVDSVRASG